MEQTINLLHKGVYLYARAKDDDECDGKAKNSAKCQKPQSDSTLTIILAVILPVVAIFVFLAVFMIRNYRKSKKEDMEHDPDFDENGEATVLPDFPSGYGKKYEMEDPFDNRNSMRFPPSNFNKFSDDGPKSSSASLSGSTRGFGAGAGAGGDPYVQSFVLPYQHQTGSKVSLDEYARQLGEFGSAYGSTPRVSAYGGPSTYGRSRNSSFSNVNHLNPTTSKSISVSPQKSNLKYETKSDAKGAPKYEGGQKYETIADNSGINDTTMDETNLNDTKDLTNMELRDDSSDNIEEVSVSESDSDVNIKPAVPKFEINYENESDMKINKSLNQKIPSQSAIHDEVTNESTDTFNTTTDHFDNQGHSAPPQFTTSRDLNNGSPFHDDAEISQTGQIDQTNQINQLHPVDLSPQGNHDETSEQIDGDFDFSNESGNISGANTVNNDHNEQMTANTSATNLDVQIDSNTGKKSPRISAFNLLKNDSDEEDEGNGVDYYDEDQVLDNGLTPEQEEELKRMKSVYKLYFDRENSVKRKNSTTAGGDSPQEFIPDPDQPLPSVDEDVLKINNNLKVDTDYSKRLTTTSSIYTDTAHVNDYSQYEQQPMVMEPQYYSQPVPQNEVQQYNYYLHDQNFQQFYQEHIQNLPPLQALRNASDIRQSTIQTYTDFQPRSKNVNANNSATSPPQKQPFVPIENDNVWTSPVSSPVMNSHPSSFGSNPNHPQGKLPSLPSATQLARSSVVMLNPVTEITKHRKFRPAGSLPTVHNNGHAYAANYQQQYTQVPPPQTNMYSQQPSTDSLLSSKRENTRRMINDMSV